MKEYDKLMNDIKVLLEEYFRIKKIDTDFSEDIYYKQTLIEIDIYIGEDYIEICLNAYPDDEKDISEHIDMGASIPIVEDENILSVNVISVFTKMYSRLEKIIDFMLEEKWLAQFF